MLEIKDLHVCVEGKEILKGLNLKIEPGQIHAIMGPNGAGKSTLAKILAGHPAYEITKGSMVFEGIDLAEKEPEERCHLGLFMSFQYPPEIPGVSTLQFLKESLNSTRKARGEKPLEDDAFAELVEEKMKDLEMRSEFKERAMNEGFSGGEKKRNEILQMAVLEPKLAVLDETDSGLDIDAMRIVACGVKRMMHKTRSLVLITHYQRLLDYIRPHFVHVLFDGKIVHSGDANLALELEEKGYDWLTL